MKANFEKITTKANSRQYWEDGETIGRERKKRNTQKHRAATRHAKLKKQCYSQDI